MGRAAHLTWVSPCLAGYEGDNLLKPPSQQLHTALGSFGENTWHPNRFLLQAALQQAAIVFCQVVLEKLSRFISHVD